MHTQAFPTLELESVGVALRRCGGCSRRWDVRFGHHNTRSAQGVKGTMKFTRVSRETGRLLQLGLLANRITGCSGVVL